MRYVTFDSGGNLTGAFTQDLHQAHSECFFEVDETVYADWTSYRFDGFGVEKMPVVALPSGEMVPQSITPRQGYIILSRYGLLAPVKAYFAALEGQEGEEAQVELEFAQEWKRSWPTLINAAQSFGLTDAQIDQMFIEASVI